jgi:hypothetical protein
MLFYTQIWLAFVAIALTPNLATASPLKPDVSARVEMGRTIDGSSDVLMPIDFSLETAKAIYENQTADPGKDSFSKRVVSHRPNVCPPNMEFGFSRCLDISTVRLICRNLASHGDPYLHDYPCTASQICIEVNGSNKLPIARCVPLAELIAWNTSPRGGNTETVKEVKGPSPYVHPRTHVGSMAYDTNGHTIQIFDQWFVAHGTNKVLGKVLNSFKAFSGLVTWSTIHAVDVHVVTGGYGSVRIFNFLV